MSMRHLLDKLGFKNEDEMREALGKDPEIQKMMKEKERMERLWQEKEAYEKRLLKHPEDEIAATEYLWFLRDHDLWEWISDPVKEILINKWQEWKKRAKELEEQGFLKVENKEKKENK